MTALHHHAYYSSRLTLESSTFTQLQTEPGCQTQLCSLVNVTSLSAHKLNIMVPQFSVCLEMKATAHGHSKAALQCCTAHGKGICCEFLITWVPHHVTNKQDTHTSR